MNKEMKNSTKQRYSASTLADSLWENDVRGHFFLKLVKFTSVKREIS